MIKKENSNFEIDVYHLDRAVFRCAFSGEYKNKNTREYILQAVSSFDDQEQIKGIFNLINENNESYKKVATFHQSDSSIDHIFEKTNNISSSWKDILPENATYFGNKDGCKSTSVGDFLMIREKGKEPTIKAYANFGFTDLPKNITSKIIASLTTENIIEKTKKKPRP